MTDRNRLRNQRLVALTVAGVLLFNYPFLVVFDTPALVLGIPVLYLYLFGVWCGFIFLAAWLLERGGDEGDADRRGDDWGS